MQSRGIFLALVLPALVFSMSGFLPDALAIDYAVSDKQSCEELPGVTSWDSNTCTLDSILLLLPEDELIINWGVTFDVTSNGNLQIGGDVLNLGTISFSGDSVILPSVIVDNFGLIIIQNGATLTNAGELGGDGEIEINGTLINEPRGKVTSLGDINNFGTIENQRRAHIDSDTFNHFSGAYIDNKGTIDITFSNIDGVIDNYNGLDFAAGLSTIGSSGVINNLDQVNFDEKATLDNYGKLESFAGSVIFHKGIINNQASGNFSNSGWLELGPYSEINNFGLLQNNEVGDICTIDECDEPYDGVIDFLSDEDHPFEIFAIVNNFGTFHNFDTIWNSCGKIEGSLSIPSLPPIDDCALIVGIFSPTEGASFTDSSVIPFFGLAIDKDGFGNVQNFSSNLIWTDSSNDVIGTGAGFPLTIPRLGTHHITATESVSQESSSVTIKIGILDLDGDGASPDPPDLSVDFDCDDNDPLRFENNLEIPDGVDNDCNNVIPPTEIDDDLDGYIEDENFDFDTWAGDSSVVGGGDCDDADANRSPGLNEINDGIDTDCDGEIPFYETDDDGDGVAEYEGDCDDDNILRYFGNSEVNDGIDNDCDGLISDEEFDHDGDGYIEARTADEKHIDTNVIGGGDCNDIDPDGFPINPGIIEDEDNIGIPNVDDNCDGIIDGIENADLDGDGALPAPGSDPFDCDDSNPFRASNQTEIVDGIDNDCSETEFDDGLLDEERDTDGDKYIIGPLVLDEFDEPIWRDQNHPTVPGDGDCDDNNGLRYPTNLEVNDGIDNDCSETEFDDGVPLTEIDNDGDHYTEDPFTVGDIHVDETLLGGGDCDDTNDTVYPGADELPDGILNDCLGTLPVEEVDNDGDGYNELQGDCDDNNPYRFLNNPEIVDGIDNDCDSLEELLPEEIDGDNDKQIPGPFELDENDEPIWRGSIFPEKNDGDCDDDNPTIFAGNTELDNGRDDNCNNEIDEGFDLDGDTFTVSFGNDCLDTPIESETDPRFGEVATILTIHVDSATVNSDALEIFNHIDDNCDGIIDNIGEKFTSPEFQENLDDKTIRDYQKMIEDLEEEIEDLEYENRKLDNKADKYEAKADKALEGNSEKAAKYLEKADKYEAKATELFEEGNSEKAAKYQKKSDYFKAKADKALEGNSEKAAKYQAKADKLRDEIASNNSLIDMNERLIHVIDVSVNNAIPDERTLLVTYDNLTDKAFDDILHDIEKNFKEIEKLEEKVAKEQEKIDKELAKDPPNQEKADEHLEHKLQAESEIKIIEDLNQVLKCAIDFTPEMLDEDKGDKKDKVENLEFTYQLYETGFITDVTDKKDNLIVSSNSEIIVVQASDFEKNKFDSKIFLTTNEITEEIHVSCSQPLFIGQTFGEYIISDLLTINGNDSCGHHDD